MAVSMWEDDTPAAQKPFDLYAHVYLRGEFAGLLTGVSIDTLRSNGGKHISLPLMTSDDHTVTVALYVDCPIEKKSRAIDNLTLQKTQMTIEALSAKLGVPLYAEQWRDHCMDSLVFAWPVINLLNFDDFEDIFDRDDFVPADDVASDTGAVRPVNSPWVSASAISKDMIVA